MSISLLNDVSNISYYIILYYKMDEKGSIYADEHLHMLYIDYSDVVITHDLIVNDDASFSNNVEVSNNLIVQGDTSFNSNVVVSGDLTATTLKFGNSSTLNTLPSNRGNDGDFLKTDGSGNLSFSGFSYGAWRLSGEYSFTPTSGDHQMWGIGWAGAAATDEYYFQGVDTIDVNESYMIDPVVVGQRSCIQIKKAGVWQFTAKCILTDNYQQLMWGRLQMMRTRDNADDIVLDQARHKYRTVTSQYSDARGIHVTLQCHTITNFIVNDKIWLQVSEGSSNVGGSADSSIEVGSNDIYFGGFRIF